MNDITSILSAIENGDPKAAEGLLPLVYEELRKLAAQRLALEKPGQTLQATALVHEAYLRLVGGDQGQDWNGRAHFFGAAAEAMRRILVDQARRKKAGKHGGGLLRVELPAGARRARVPLGRPHRARRGAGPARGARPRGRAIGQAAPLRRPLAPGGRGRPGHQPRCRGPPLGAGPGLAIPPTVEIVGPLRFFRAQAPVISRTEK